jgi:hypothetical protein
MCQATGPATTATSASFACSVDLSPLVEVRGQWDAGADQDGDRDQGAPAEAARDRA